jgi:hypothetical protein
MAATGWQAHTVRGFVSILRSKDGEKIESKNQLAHLNLTTIEALTSEAKLYRQ